MPIEGISMTTVFSLITVGLALSLSAFIGGYYLQPSFDVSSIMSGVAYDIAAMYDIAYTLPGEVSLKYYGPTACLWNYNQPSDSPTSFHCFSSEAVLIQDVEVDVERLYVYNDPYMLYDENIDSNILASAYSQERPAVLQVSIPYYDAQLCPFSIDSGFSYCALAQAPMAGSYNDLDILDADSPFSVAVSNYAFVVNKSNVGNYYSTLVNSPSSPSNLITFLNVLGFFYNSVCEKEGSYLLTNELLVYDSGSPAIFNSEIKEQTFKQNNEDKYFVELFRGNKWHVYEDNILCQERIIYNDTGIEAYYISDYCFDIRDFVARNPCNNIQEVRFTPEFINIINTETTYYASQSSCIKPYMDYDNGDIIIGAYPAEFNFFAESSGGVCQNA